MIPTHSHRRFICLMVQLARHRQTNEWARAAQQDQRRKTKDLGGLGCLQLESNSYMSKLSLKFELAYHRAINIIEHLRKVRSCHAVSDPASGPDFPWVISDQKRCWHTGPPIINAAWGSSDWVPLRQTEAGHLPHLGCRTRYAASGRAIAVASPFYSLALAARL